MKKRVKQILSVYVYISIRFKTYVLGVSMVLRLRGETRLPASLRCIYRGEAGLITIPDLMNEKTSKTNIKCVCIHKYTL